MIDDCPPLPLIALREDKAQSSLVWLADRQSEQEQFGPSPECERTVAAKSDGLMSAVSPLKLCTCCLMLAEQLVIEQPAVASMFFWPAAR